MQKYRVTTPEQALLYLADCTLATVADMAMKKSKSKSEFKRQIAIAQTAVDWIRDFKLDVEKEGRVKMILHLGGSVAKWAESYDCA